MNIDVKELQEGIDLQISEVKEDFKKMMDELMEKFSGIKGKQEE